MNARQRSVFYSQLERLLETGVSLRSGLEMLGRHEKAAYSAPARAMLGALDRGESLSSGLRRSGLKLPELHLRLLELGEVSGRLPEILSRLRELDAEQRKLRTELVGPIVYPVVLLMASILVSPLPKLVSDGTDAYLGAVFTPLAPILGTLLVLFAAAKLWPDGWARLLDHVPIVAGVRQGFAGSHFLYTLGTALEVGLGMPEALAAAARSTTSPQLASLGERCRQEAMTGRFELGNLVRQGHFGAFAGQVLMAAAETGTVGTAARNAAKLLHDDALAAARRAIQLGGAAIYLAAATVVALTVIRFYSQLYATTGL